jgi:hypothetical protein
MPSFTRRADVKDLAIARHDPSLILLTAAVYEGVADHQHALPGFVHHGRRRPPERERLFTNVLACASAPT